MSSKTISLARPYAEKLAADKSENITFDTNDTAERANYSEITFSEPAEGECSATWGEDGDEKIEEPAPTPAPAPKRAKISPDDQDFYKCVTARDYDSYLRKYPNGKHRAEAAQALAGLVNQVDHTAKGQVLEEITPGQTPSGPPPMVDGSDFRVRNSNTSINLRLGSSGGGFSRVSSDAPSRNSGMRSSSGGMHSGGGGMRSSGSSHSSSHSSGGGPSNRHSRPH